jgi:FkbM family methyltransferase
MGALRYALPLTQAALGADVSLRGARLRVPGALPIRLSVVAGNIRMHRLMDAAVRPGGTAVDVGANVGYNAVYAALRVGPAGRVFAIEPAADNVAVLRENLARNAIGNVVVHEAAAGRTSERRDFYLRGDVSAVNSLFPDSMYGAVSGVARVRVERLDDLVDGPADLVKIDVEGAELEVLAGMPRLLANPRLTLIAEWHPRLQQAAGAAADGLPRELLRLGFTLRAVSHTRDASLSAGDIPRIAARLLRAGRPVELVARRVRL